MMKEAAISPGQLLAYSVKNFSRPTGIVIRFCELMKVRA